MRYRTVATAEAKLSGSGHAQAGSDFTAVVPDDNDVAANTLTFAPGTTTQTISIDILGDMSYEADFFEKFDVELYENDETRTELLNDGRATGTIEDDDVARDPAISVAAVSGKEKIFEGGMLEFEFTSDQELSSSLWIFVTLEETGDFLSPSISFMPPPDTRTSLNIASGTSSTTKHIARFPTIADDLTFGTDSKVTLTVIDGAGYDPGSNPSATVIVFDKSTPTGISVLAISGETDEVRDNETELMFQIKSHKDTDASTARVINVAVDDGDADFLKM